MEYLLVFAVAISLGITFLCALTEAALYAVPYASVKHLADSGSIAGKALLRFKEDMSTPITAILVLNTAGATVGSAVVGAVAASVFSPELLIIFAFLFGTATLYLAEITPKIAGVIYAKPISRFMAIPLNASIVALAPFIWVSKGLKKVLEPKEDLPSVSHQEVLSMTEIGKEEGSIDDFEGSVISNVIELDQLLVRDVLTPRVVVFRLSESTTLEEVEKDIQNWNYTRVPTHREDDTDDLQGYVIQRDLYREILRGNKTKTLKDLARQLPIVPELMRVDQLLLRMFEHKEHICGVVDEHGAFVGIITLEDILEEVVGREIVDEYDTVSDLRSFARVMRNRKR